MRRPPASALYHAGQLEVQARAGVVAEAASLGRIVRPALPAPGAAFLADRRLLVLGSVAADGWPWASALAGPSGFARALDDRTVRITARPAPGDPLLDNLRATGLVGLLAVDFATRRRLRVNGRGVVEPDGAVVVRAEQVFGNCPSYIQLRALEASPPGAAHGADATEYARTDALAPAQRAWIERADTCFVATARPDGGADASHRGGRPGFVRAPSPGRVVWPDYPGNNMFLTLGNLQATGRAGLLFLDFEEGRTLQVSGRAQIDWDAARAATHPDAGRLIEVQVEAVVESRLPGAPRWRLLGYAPEAPPVA